MIKATLKVDTFVGYSFSIDFTAYSDDQLIQKQEIALQEIMSRLKELEVALKSIEVTHKRF